MKAKITSITLPSPIHARAELPQRERQGLSDGVARSCST
jgi:hypothetical protein